jgi:hypothetical protein
VIWRKTLRVLPKTLFDTIEMFLIHSAVSKCIITIHSIVHVGDSSCAWTLLIKYLQLYLSYFLAFTVNRYNCTAFFALFFQKRETVLESQNVAPARHVYRCRFLPFDITPITVLMLMECQNNFYDHDKLI